MKTKGQWNCKRVEHSQLLTRKEVVLICIRWLMTQPFFKNMEHFIEPSAGAGAFLLLEQIANVLVEAYDLYPQGPLGEAGIIQKKDFREFTCSYDPTKTLIYGAPPVGNQSCYAVKFINLAAKWADYIAFLLPASFRGKPAIWRRIDANIDLYAELDVELPKKIFYVYGTNEEVGAKVVFQIWYRNRGGRLPEIAQKVRSGRKVPRRVEAFEFVTHNDAYDTIIERVGSGGRVLDVKQAKEKRHDQLHYIKIHRHRREVLEFLNDNSWKDVIKRDTSGAENVSRFDINRAWEERACRKLRELFRSGDLKLSK